MDSDLIGFDHIKDSQREFSKHQATIALVIQRRDKWVVANAIEGHIQMKNQGIASFSPE